MKNDKLHTDIWRKYEKCKEYADKKQIVAKTEKFWNFYVGNQWKGLESGGEELPKMNFIKPIVQYKVSSVAQNVMVAKYSDMTANSALNGVYESLNKYWEQCWEKSKMNDVVWRVLKAAAIQSDSYVYWADGNTLQPPQIIPNTSIYLSDENVDDIQSQKFIIIHERWDLESVKKLARDNGVSEEDIANIFADDETERELFNKTEVEDKVSVLLYMEKDEDGIVRTGRSTNNVIVEPLDKKVNVNGKGEVKAKLTTYPIIPYVWELVPNSARGVGEVEQLIPNQLELNKTLARRSMAVKMAAYPRLAYDATAIENPEDLDKVGVAIAMQGGSAQSINQMISYLNPANIASDALALSNDLLQNTKDLAGASDYALGNINPEQASGTAIIAVRDQSQVPLNEQNARLKQWVEDVSLLWMDLWRVFNSDGITYEYEDPNTLQTYTVNISQEELKDLSPTVRIDVSNDNQWTKLAEQQSVDLLLQMGAIDLEGYAEITPDNSSVPKQRIKEYVQKKKAEAMIQQKQMMQQQMMQQPQQEETSDIDQQAVLQQLIQQGVPERDAMQMVESYMQQLGANA